MKIIKLLLFITAFVLSLAYVDLKINEMYTEPKVIIFEEIYKSVKSVWD